MPKFGDVILSLSGKAGIKKDDENLKKLLALPEVSMFDLPDELANALERNLLTVDSAVANADVRSRIMPDLLNPVDTNLIQLMNDFELDDSFKGEIKGIKSTYDKQLKVNAKLKEKLKEAQEKASSSKDPKDKAEVEVLRKEIEGANQKMESMKQMFDIEKQNLMSSHLNDKKEFTLKSTLSGKPLPKNGLPTEINILTAKTILQQDMARNGLIVTFDDADNPILKQRKDGAEIDFFENNKKINYSDYIDGVLAHNKFIQVNDQQQQQQSGTGNNGFQAQPGALSNSAIVAETNAQLAQLGIGAQV